MKRQSLRIFDPPATAEKVIIIFTRGVRTSVRPSQNENALQR